MTSHSFGHFMSPLPTKGCMGEQASLEFDLTFGDVLLHKLVQAYYFNLLRYTLFVIYQSELIQTQYFIVIAKI